MPDLTTEYHSAPSISLILDHVQVVCKPGHHVTVSVYDVETRTLSMWHFRPVDGGHWDMDSTCVGVAGVTPTVN